MKTLESSPRLPFGAAPLQGPDAFGIVILPPRSGAVEEAPTERLPLRALLALNRRP